MLGHTRRGWLTLMTDKGWVGGTLTLAGRAARRGGVVRARRVARVSLLWQSGMNSMVAGTHAGAHATRLARYIPCHGWLTRVADTGC